MTDNRKIVVVGAGIIGASIAWHLARRGASVTVLAEEAGGVATPNSFAWINASWGNDQTYFRLRSRSIAEWARMAAELPDLPLARTGGLCWDMPPDELRTYVREYGSWGYRIRLVGRDEIARLEPHLAVVPETAALVEDEAAVEPVAAARLMLDDAARTGAELFTATANFCVRRRGRVTGVDTSAGAFEADAVVLAAGTGTPDLAASVGISVPLERPPGLLVHSQPHRRLVNGLIIAPDIHLRQTAEGRLVAGSDFGGSHPGRQPEEVAAQLFDKVRDMVRGADDLKYGFHTVGYRPTPSDGHPIVGEIESHPGVYVAVMHSGITLAPAIGRLVAEELLTGRRDPLLRPYGPGRFN